METRVIDIDREAFECLSAARVDHTETFSQVIKRSVEPAAARTCGELLKALPRMAKADPDVLEKLESAQAADVPPDHPWG
jgi:hypothetical protein